MIGSEGIHILAIFNPITGTRVDNRWDAWEETIRQFLTAINHISTVKEANEFLKKDFLPKFNARFMVEPRSKANLPKKLPKKLLDNLLSSLDNSRAFAIIINNKS